MIGVPNNINNIQLITILQTHTSSTQYMRLCGDALNK